MLVVGFQLCGEVVVVVAVGGEFVGHGGVGVVMGFGMIVLNRHGEVRSHLYVCRSWTCSPRFNGAPLFYFTCYCYLAS